MFDYDLLVLGAGSGGVRAARLAAAHGLKVLVVEHQLLGGTCVNVGCVPKKLYSYAAGVAETMQLAPAYGWDLRGSLEHSWECLQANVQRELRRLNSVYARLLEHSGAEVLFGSARFLDAHRVVVDDRELSAAKIIIATGSSPAIPKLEGAELFANSDDFFAWRQAPKSLLIYGGGYIGLELAAISVRLGVETHLVVRKDTPLTGFDSELRAFIADQLPNCGVHTHFGCSVTSLSANADGGVQARLSDGSSLLCERALATTGRKPLVAALNLSAAGVDLDASGALAVDEHYQTSAEHIYAIGDVIGRLPLTPVAIREAVYCFRRHLAGEQPRAVNYDLVPTAVFTQPNIGSVGYSEQQARDLGWKVETRTTQFKALRNQLAEHGGGLSFYKLVLERGSGKVLGIHIAGDAAGEIIQGFAAALVAGLHKDQLDACVGVHPTSAEELVTM